MLTKDAQSNYANGNGNHAESNGHHGAPNNGYHAEPAFVTRAEYEHVLKERDTLLRLIDSLPDSIYAKDAEGRFLISNRKNTELLGKRCASDVVGKTDFDFYDAELAEKYRQDEFLLINSGQDVVHAEEPNVNNLTGEKRWILTTKVVQRDETGAPTALFGIGRDITARKRVEETLRKSEEIFRKTVNTVPSVIYQLKFEPDGSYSYPFISDRCQELYEVSAEDVMRDARILTKMWHPDDVQEYWRQIKCTLDNLVPLDVTVRIITPSGKIKWVRVNSRPEKQPDGSIVLYGVRTDITAQKETEATLLEQQAQMNAAADLAKLAFWQGDLQRQTFIFNERCFALLGTSLEKEGSFEISVQDYLGRFVLAEDVPETLRHLQAVLSSADLSKGEAMYRIRRADDGSIRYIKVIYNVERAADGVPARLFGPMQDITEQKQAEQRLRESALRLLEAQRVARIGDFDFDLATGELKWSEEEYAVFGVDKSVTPTFDVFVNAIYPQDRERVVSDFQTALGNPSVNRLRLEFRVLHPNGEVRYTNGEVVIVRDEQGKPLRSYGTNQDITEQKLAEMKTLEQQAQMNAAADLAKLAFWQGDLQRQTFIFNERCFALLGTSLEKEGSFEISVQDYLGRFVLAEDVPETLRHLQAVLSSADLSKGEAMYRIRRADDGSIRYIKVIYNVERAADGVPARLFGPMQDITEQKLAEAKLIEQQAQMNAAADLARLAFWELDFATYAFTFNDRYYALLGTDIQREGGYQMSAEQYFGKFVPQDAVGKLVAEIQAVAASTETQGVSETLVRRTDGEIRNMMLLYRVERSADGAPIRTFGAIQDITVQKQAEEKLRRSEEKFRNTVSSLPGMIYQIVFHADGTVSYPFVSEGSRAIYGIEPEAIMQDASVITKMWHPDDIGEYMRRVEECRRTLKPFDMDCRIALPDGTIKWLHVKSMPQLEPDGSLRFYGVRTDITKQKELEEEVARKEENFRKTVNAVPGMIYQFALLPDGTVQMPYASGGCRDIFGFEPETIMANPMALFGMMDPEDVAASQVAIAESAANMSPFVYETRFMLPTGKVIWTRWQGRPAKREDGLIVWYGICTDITQLKVLEAELQARLKEIQETQKHLIQSEKMTALGQMVAGVAHELNTPIGYASNNVSIIRDRFKSVTSLLRKAIEAQECIYNNQLEQAFAKMQEVSNSPNGTLAELDETIRRTDRLFAGISSGFEQMSNLVKSMRNFSRLDEAEMKKADINEGLRSCLLMIGHQLKDKNIELVTEYGEIPMVDCFPAQLNQVFLNLIGNAIHAVEEKPDGKICVQSSLEADFVVVRVIDNGKGIPKHVQSKIFDPFFTTKPVGKGTGLGLSICYNIVQKHNGQLYFETEEGVGTTFFVKIPAVDFLGTQS